MAGSVHVCGEREINCLEKSHTAMAKRAVPDAVSMMDQSAAHIRTGDVQVDDRGCREKGLDWKGLKFGRFFPLAPSWVPEKRSMVQ